MSEFILNTKPATRENSLSPGGCDLAGTGPHVDEAYRIAATLQVAGFHAVVEPSCRDGIEISVRYQEYALGNVVVQPTGHVTYSEIRLAVFGPAVEAACDGRIQQSVTLAETAWREASGAEVDRHLYIASSSYLTHSTFGAVMVSDGICCNELTGVVSGPAVLADIECSARALLQVTDHGPGRIAVCAPAHVEKYARGLMTACEPKLAGAVMRLQEALQFVPGIVWTPRNTASSGYRLAKYLADDAFAEIEM